MQHLQALLKAIVALDIEHHVHLHAEVPQKCTTGHLLDALAKLFPGFRLSRFEITAQCMFLLKQAPHFGVFGWRKNEAGIQVKKARSPPRRNHAALVLISRKHVRPVLEVRHDPQT